MGRRVSRSFAGQFPIFFRALLVSFDFDFSEALLKGAHFSFWPRSVQRLDNAIHRINRYPADKC